MSINVRAYKLFFKYLLSYLFILFIPLVVLGSLIYFYFIGIFQQEVMNNNINKLDRIRYVIDDQLKQIRVINNQIYFKNLNTSLFEDDPLTGLKTINELKNYIYLQHRLSYIYLSFVISPCMG